MINKKDHMILWICKNKFKNFCSLKNVLGIGLGMKYINSKNSNNLCIQVLVKKKEPLKNLSYNDIIPKSYMNIDTDVIEIGEVHAYGLKSKIRPVQCGYSIGPINKFYSGTCGCIVERGVGRNIDYFLLSNNHVLANTNRLSIGTAIVQPARSDGGSSQDIIANLTEFIPISFNGSQRNLVDCAIARITDNSIISNKIAWAGYPTGINSARIGEKVEKVGRTTGRTSGFVRTIGTSIYINFGRSVLFQNQIITDRMSNSGDSGSVILNENNEAVGLLMAGSPYISIANNFLTVLNSLRVKLTY